MSVLAYEFEPSPATRRPNVVLASGGIDSTVVAWQIAERGPVPELLFVDYGQASRRAERTAVQAVAEVLHAPLAEVRLEDAMASNGGEIPFRNALLVTTAAAARPHALTLSLGIHAGTGYPDCSPEFVRMMQTLLDFHGVSPISLVAPLVDLTKGDVVALATHLGVPFELTYSCELADEPCGACRSCLDRTVLGVI